MTIHSAGVHGHFLYLHLLRSQGMWLSGHCTRPTAERQRGLPIWRVPSTCKCCLCLLQEKRPACWEPGFQAWAQSTCPELSGKAALGALFA